MREDKAGLLVSEIFHMATPLSRDQRLSLALALVHNADKPTLEGEIQLLAHPSMCEDCIDGIGPE